MRAGHQSRIKPLSEDGARRHGLATTAESRDLVRSPGTTLTSTVRNFFEPRFGYDFGHVRVHSDGEAARTARAVDAPAYTIGSRIVMEPQYYQPETPMGRA